MSLRINTNTDALNAHRQLTATSLAMSKSMEKLSSGLRINRAADDAAGLAISEKMRAQIRGVAQANRNAMDGISMVQSAEGALNEVHAILQRVRELAVQYNNGTLSTADKCGDHGGDRAALLGVLAIVSQMTFNGINVLGSTSPITFQVGANTGETIILNGMNLGGTYFDSVFVGTFTTGADIDAIDMSLSLDRGRPGRPRCHPEPPRAHDREPRDVPREPLRRRVAHPRHGHGARDDDLHEAPGAPAVRRGHARPGQPGAERGALADPRLALGAPRRPPGRIHRAAPAPRMAWVSGQGRRSPASYGPREPARCGPTRPPPTGRRGPHHGGRFSYLPRGRDEAGAAEGTPAS